MTFLLHQGHARYCCIAVFALPAKHIHSECILFHQSSGFIMGCWGSPVTEVGVRCLAKFVQDVHEAHLP